MRAQVGEKERRQITGKMGLFCVQGKNDFQTEADRAAQRCIVASLHRQFPKVAIHGEEVGFPHTLQTLTLTELNIQTGPILWRLI